jgi:hypothetical protein
MKHYGIRLGWDAFEFPPNVKTYIVGNGFFMEYLIAIPKECVPLVGEKHLIKARPNTKRASYLKVTGSMDSISEDLIRRMYFHLKEKAMVQARELKILSIKAERDKIQTTVDPNQLSLGLDM